MNPAGFPHSDILGSQLGCQLPEAYRRLLRPSSAPDAKASTVCPYTLTYLPNSTTHPTTHTPPPQEQPTGHQAAIRRTLKDARVHCTVLKQQPDPAPHPAPTPTRTQFAEGPAQKKHTPQGLFPQDPTARHNPLTHQTRFPHQHPRHQPYSQTHQDQKPHVDVPPRAAPPPHNEQRRPSHDTSRPTTTADPPAPSSSLERR
jgi:hypothetical protein